MNFENYTLDKRVCNGICMPREKFSEERIAEIKGMLPEIRKEFIEKFGTCDHNLNLFAGSRLNDDDDIVARMESANKEKAEKLELREFIIHAIIDCANSDYYYRFEKDCGN